MTKNYYEILEINKDATPEQIKSAYRKLALKYHPDKNNNSKTAEEEFKKILQAYDTLYDSVAKRKYDDEIGSSDSEPKKSPAKPKGEIEEKVYVDWRKEITQIIQDALNSNYLTGYEEKKLGPKFFDIVGHRQCDGGQKFFPYLHVYYCLDTKSEAESFRNKLLGLIADYRAELTKFKEEAIMRIDKYYNSKKSELSEYARKLFNNRKYNSDDGINVEDWRDNIRKSCKDKDTVIYFEEVEMKLIDQFLWASQLGKSSSSSVEKEKELKRILEEKETAKKTEKDKKGYKENGDKNQNGKDNSHFPPDHGKENHWGGEDPYKQVYDKILYKIESSQPFVSVNELDPSLWSPYSNWIDKFWKLEVNELDKFLDSVLNAIAKAQEKKQKEKLNSDFQEADQKTGKDLKETIDDIDKQRGSQAFEDNKKKIEDLKKKAAGENPEAYRQETAEKIAEEMERKRVKKEDLGEKGQTAYQVITSGTTKNTEEIVAAEMTLMEETEKVSASKQLEQLLQQIQQLLESGSQPERKKLKERILEFGTNSNIFCQEVYKNRWSEIKTWLDKLDNYKKDEPNQENLQTEVSAWNNSLIAIALIAGLGIFLIAFLLGISSKRKKRRR